MKTSLSTEMPKYIIWKNARDGRYEMQYNPTFTKWGRNAWLNYESAGNIVFEYDSIEEIPSKELNLVSEFNSLETRHLK